jgi:hypothetical protein
MTVRTWLLLVRDAPITGELFPGRPLCRPGVELAEFDKGDACCVLALSAN